MTGASSVSLRSHAAVPHLPKKVLGPLTQRHSSGVGKNTVCGVMCLPHSASHETCLETSAVFIHQKCLNNPI